MSQPEPIEELVGFLASPRQDIRMIACGNLVGYSNGPQNSIFKPAGLKPIKDLKILVRDQPNISESALKILVNVSDDKEVLNLLCTDDTFLELLISRIVDITFPPADYVAMLLANMAKHEDLPEKLLKMKRDKPKPEWKVSDSDKAMDQLMDVFVKGSKKTLNKHADFDHLSYLFADVARHPKARKYFVEPQTYDGVVPLTKITVFTEHESFIRRKGVASTIKNSLFETSAHKRLIADSSTNILPYILLPLMGSEEYPTEESLDMPAEVQLLPPDKERDTDKSIISAHLDSIMLLTTSRPVRETLREVQVYPIIREVHLAVEDEDVRDICERIVNVLQRDEADEETDKVAGVEDDDEIVDLA